MELADWVRKGRKRKGLTQQAFSDAVQVNVRTVRLWEAGEATPRDQAMARLEAFIGQPGDPGDDQLPAGQWIDVLGGGGRMPFPAGVIDRGSGAELRAVPARGRGQRGLAIAVVDVSEEAMEALAKRGQGRVVVADGDAWVLGDLAEGRVFRRSGGALKSDLPKDAQVLPVVAVFEAMA